MIKRQDLLLERQQINLSIGDKVKIFDRTITYPLFNNRQSKHKILQGYNCAIIKTVEWLIADFYQIEYHGSYNGVDISFDNVDEALESSCFLGITMVSPWSTWSCAKDIKNEFNDLKYFIDFFDLRIWLGNKNPAVLLNPDKHLPEFHHLRKFLKNKPHCMPLVELAAILLLSTPLNLIANLRNFMVKSYYYDRKSIRVDDWQKVADCQGVVVSFESIIDYLLINLKYVNSS